MHNQASERPQLLVLTSTYPRWAGDPEPGFVHELSRRLVEKYDVTVLCPAAAGAQLNELMDGVHVKRFRYAPTRWQSLVNDGGIAGNLRRSPWKWLLVPTFITSQAIAAWKLIRSMQPQVVHAHWLIPQGALVALLGLVGRRIPPFVVTSHGADLFTFRGWPLSLVKRIVANRAAELTVVSSAMRDPLCLLGANRATLSVLPMGVDMERRFRPNVAIQRSEREILFVGRLVEKKGLKYLIDAMPPILRRFPDARLLIAGFGPEERALKKQARILGLDDSVEFLGGVKQADLPGLYQRAAVFVAPFVRARSGDQEGLGLVLVEAIGCGCPILAGNVPALVEVLGDDFKDMAVDPRDTPALASHLVGALEDPEFVRERAMRLRERCVEKFDWRQVAEAYGKVLDRAVSIGAQ